LKPNSYKAFFSSIVILFCFIYSSCLLARDLKDRVNLEKPMALDFHSSRTANVWTVLTNWGQIGGYWPAFEWPGGSGNHYLWEGGIWIGGKDQDGGIHCVTQFFNEEEFQPTFAADDTVCLYNSSHPYFQHRPNINPMLLGSQISAEDTYAEYDDLDVSKHGIDQSPLGIKVIERTYKWTASYNDDFIIFDYQIINIGLDTDQDLAADTQQKLSGVYIGMWLDADVSESAGGYLYLDDLTAYYADKQISYIYDGDDPYLPGNDEGENGLSLGYVYARLLKSSSGPDSVSYSEPHSHSWWILGNDPSSENLKYSLMSTANFADPPPTPHDVRFVQSTGPYDLEPNDTVNVVWAMGVGNGLSGIIRDSDWAKRIFDAGYLAASAPDPPQLSVEKGDNFLRLYWDNAAESSLDPLTGQNDFEGYRLYKNRTVDDLGNKIWTKLADFDMVNAIGANTGLKYEFIDTDVLNAYTYSYVITAYDQGDSDLGLDILESSRREPKALQNVTIGGSPKNTVDDIYVYPNPYIGSVEWDHIPTQDEPYERKLVFANLPAGEVKIQVFTLAGDLVDTIKQNNGESIAAWDMITKYNRKLVSGIYMYTVETERGIHIGKFVVIQ